MIVIIATLISHVPAWRAGARATGRDEERRDPRRAGSLRARETLFAVSRPFESHITPSSGSITQFHCVRVALREFLHLAPRLVWTCLRRRNLLIVKASSTQSMRLERHKTLAPPSLSRINDAREGRRRTVKLGLGLEEEGGAGRERTTKAMTMAIAMGMA
jgi:hypothetical protein